MIKGGVVQSGAVTPGDLTSWKAASVIQDAGVTAASAIAVLASASRVLGNQGVPMVVLGTATYGSNGAATLSTALAATPAITSCYGYVPANSVAAAFTAGWYYCVFSSTTAFIVYNNPTYTAGTPVIPGTPTPFVATGQGSVAGSSAAITAYSLSIPGNTLGLNGGLRVSAAWSYTSSAANKTMAINYGSASLMTQVATTTASMYGIWGIKNEGAAALQLLMAGTASGLNIPTANAVQNSGVDSTTAQSLAVVMTNATPATNNMVLGNTTVELLPSVV